jgi:hypothetical protein
MRNRVVGEWILSAVTTPDRAEAIVGDLAEHHVSPIRFWTEISSNVLHAIDRPTIATALICFLTQFLVFAFLGWVFIYCATASKLSLKLWHICLVLICLGTQILTGVWIGIAKKKPLLVCSLVSALDCALGLADVSDASVNMATWAVPAFLGTLAVYLKQTGTARRISDRS